MYLELVIEIPRTIHCSGFRLVGTPRRASLPCSVCDQESLQLPFIVTTSTRKR